MAPRKTPRLRLDPNNARIHGDRSKAAIRESLERVGPGRSIFVDGDDIVRAGNGVYEQALTMGLRVTIVDADPDELIAVRRSDLRGEQAVQAALYDNRAGELSEWNTDVLQALASFSPDNLLGELWTPDEVAQLLAPEPTPQAPPSQAPPLLPGQPHPWATPYTEGATINGNPIPFTPDAMGPLAIPLPPNAPTGYTPQVAKLPEGVNVATLDDGPAPVKNGEDAQAFLATYPVKLGDIWAIPSLTAPGQFHLIACGDARDPMIYAALFPHTPPLLMQADPPYGKEVNTQWRIDAGLHPYAYDHAVYDTITNDHIVDWSSVYRLWQPQVLYAWHASLKAWDVATSLVAADYQIRSQIIWAKNTLVISQAHYHWMHEPCWYAVKNGATANWQSDRKQTTLWAVPNRRSDDPADAFDGGHISQKPVALFRAPLLNHTVPGDIVAEPFSGTGSHYVAAEQLGRIVYGCDLEPCFVAATLARLAAMGLHPHKYGELAG